MRIICLELCMKIRSNSVPTTPKSNYLELLVEHDLIVVYRFYSITFWTYVFVIKMAVNCLYVQKHYTYNNTKINI